MPIGSDPIKVGKNYEGFKNPLNYLNVDFDEDKWADSSKFLPADFDLVWCEIENKEKCLPGWHANNSWDGLSIKQEHKVLRWKLNHSF